MTETAADGSNVTAYTRYSSARAAMLTLSKTNRNSSPELWRETTLLIDFITYIIVRM
jgi:hypothetical protein